VLVPNPKAQANNFDTRTDRVCYIRDAPHDSEAGTTAPVCGPALLWCHRRLRAVAKELEDEEVAPFLVPAWTQLAMYSEGGGFYRWHADGLNFPATYWLMGPAALYLWLRWGAIRRRALTAIVYLNTPDRPWGPEDGGTLRCRLDGAKAWHLRVDGSAGAMELVPAADGVLDVRPEGGRLVLFDSQRVEHEVAPTFRQRWALTSWLHR